MRRLLCVLVLSHLSVSVAHAQLSDGECTHFLDPAPYNQFIEDEVGLFDLADFAIQAPLAATSPVADGVLSASEYPNECYFTFAENENPGQSWPALDNLEDGDPDLTASLHFAHTPEFLFVAFEVTDDFLDLDEGANSFQNDGVELFFNPDLDLGDGWGAGKFQIYVDAAGEGDIEFNNRGHTSGIVALTTDDSPPEAGEFYSAGLTTEAGYVVEFQIPLESLDKSGGDDDLDPVQTGDFVLINAAIDDNDEDDDLSAQTGHHLLWHFDGANSPFGGGEDIWPVALALTDAVGNPSPGDIDGDGDCDADDIDALAAGIRGGETDTKFDVNGDGTVNADDHGFMVSDLKDTYLGDSNLDGEFGSGDLVQVFTNGKYDTGEAAGWIDGDWNGDGTFGSGDLVAAFTEGGYETGPKPASAVPEPSSFALLLFACGLLGCLRRT